MICQNLRREVRVLMLRAGMNRSVGALLAGVACLFVSPASAAPLIKLSGTIAGIVNDPSGVPRMGATVLLLNRQDRLYGKTFSDSKGEFRFANLFPDSYTVRVSLATFMPATQREVAVQP